MSNWCLVADGARARLFRANSWLTELEQFETIINEDGRLRNRDFETDAPGRSFTGQNRRSAMEKEESPKQRNERQFAKKLADKLNNAVQQGKFNELIIIAAPKALGNIREELNSGVKRAVTGTSSKNYTKATRDEIAEHIEKAVLN